MAIYETNYTTKRAERRRQYFADQGNADLPSQVAPTSQLEESKARQLVEILHVENDKLANDVFGLRSILGV